MKLAAALAVRSDAQRRLEQLTARAAGCARYQEGEPPTDLADAAVGRSQDGYGRINEASITPRTGGQSGAPVTGKCEGPHDPGLPVTGQPRIGHT